VEEALRRRDLGAAGVAARQLAAVRALAGGDAPARARTQAELGDIWSLLADYGQAHSCYSEALALAPGDPRHWLVQPGCRVPLPGRYRGR
jgi:hypothetical protein